MFGSKIIAIAALVNLTSVAMANDTKASGLDALEKLQEKGISRPKTPGLDALAQLQKDGISKPKTPGLEALAKLQEEGIKPVETPNLDKEIKKIVTDVCRFGVSKKARVAYVTVNNKLITDKSTTVAQAMESYIDMVDNGECHAPMFPGKCVFDKETLRFAYKANGSSSWAVTEDSFTSEAEAEELIKELSVNKNDKESQPLFADKVYNRNVCR